MFPIVIGLLCVLISVYFFFKTKKKPIVLLNEHVLITGGSSGIGLAFAIEVAEKGASVTILARNEARLEEAKAKVLPYAKAPSQKVFAISADVSRDHEALKRCVSKAEEVSGPITMLVNCAGTSTSSYFHETTVEDYQRMMDVNYMGTVYMTRAVLPSMKKHRRGKIVFFSSLAGLVGLFGYTAYSPSKFAIVGFAEAFKMEVHSYDISVTVSFPPDTDTPGFAEEMRSKPIETRQISESGGIYSAQEVAAKTLKDTMEKRFMSSVGFEGWMVCTLCCGMTPVHSWGALILQVFTMGIFRLMGYVYLTRCDETVKHHAEMREED